MDRNSVTGFVLIGVLFIAYMLLVQPPETDKTAANANDSTQVINEATTDTTSISNAIINNNNNSIAKAEVTEVDSVSLMNMQNNLSEDGLFVQKAGSSESEHIIENDKMKITLSNKGGKIKTIEVKNYVTHDSLPLILMDGDTNKFNYTLGVGKQIAETENYFFDFVEKSANKAVLRLYHADSSSYIEQEYSLTDGSYLMDINFKLNNFDEHLGNKSILQLNWENQIRQQERDLPGERRVSGIYYKETENSGSDYLKEAGSDDESVEFSLDWVAFKQQFFNTTLLTKEDGFSRASLKVTEPKNEKAPYIERSEAKLSFVYNKQPNYVFPMQMYVGPNDYKVLKTFDNDMESMIPLGWAIFRWVNIWVLIPMFAFLGKFISNYGIIILVLTLVIKLVLFPLTYRSLRSFAKMNVLKPEIEALQNKYKDNKEKLQAAQLQLYSKAGVNPIGGCIPQLLQFPILIAMYRFFPASIELRQESFLWADDLSTYDSIMSLPFEIPFYGDHVSLFCLLSVVASLLYIRLNSSMTPSAGSSEMQSQMKMIQYVMPVMLLFFFNSFSAGLTYYFFLSQIIGFGQTLAIKNYFIDEDALLKQIQENKKKPTKQSSFQKRLAAMAEQQQAKRRELENRRSGVAPEEKQKRGPKYTPKKKKR